MHTPPQSPPVHTRWPGARRDYIGLLQRTNAQLKAEVARLSVIGRRPGYYHVWPIVWDCIAVARYQPGEDHPWTLPGELDAYDDTDFTWIGERIPDPIIHPEPPTAA